MHHTVPKCMNMLRNLCEVRIVEKGKALLETIRIFIRQFLLFSFCCGLTEIVCFKIVPAGTTEGAYWLRLVLWLAAGSICYAANLVRSGSILSDTITTEIRQTIAILLGMVALVISETMIPFICLVCVGSLIILGSDCWLYKLSPGKP